MENFWFLMTLILDTIPVSLLSLYIMRDQLPTSIFVALAKILSVLLGKDLIIFFLFTNGYVNSQVMVGLRVLGAFLAAPLFYWVFHKYKYQFIYKSLFSIPYILLVIELAAVGVNIFDTEAWPDFMAITCFRIVIYIVFAYPYYLSEKKVLFSSFDIDDDRIWKAFIIAQLILFFNMAISLRSDYAENGIEIRQLLQQFISTIASLAVSLIMFYGLRMSRNVELYKEKQKRDEMLLDLNMVQYSSIRKNIEMTSQFRHDFKHHMRIVSQLITEEKYDEVQKYLQEYNSTIPENSKIKFCDRLSINAILEYYYQNCKEKNIAVRFDLAPLSDCTIEDVDLNILLGNAIENAIEACLTIPEDDRRIIAAAKIMANRVFITVDNSFDGEVKKENGRFMSRKRKYSENGYGIASMEAIAEKYNGSIKREIKYNIYQVSIVLEQGE